MTEEQIKALKEGDKFTIEFTVKVNEVGNFLIAEAGGKTYLPEYGCIGLQEAKLVTPPPTFEVGDTVRIIRDPLTGHAHNRVAAFDNLLGKTFTIRTIDTIGGSVQLNDIYSELTANIHCLELVKHAVKDKYAVEEDDLAWCVSEKGWSICSFNKSSHPNAKAAAEAECARLNSEWRKQQEGGAE